MNGYEKGTDEGGYYIRCNRCKRQSYHPDDIEANYCGWCHRFHDDSLRAPGEPIERTLLQARIERDRP